MPEEADRQSTSDNEHLKLLSWGYMISAGFAGLISLFGLIYAVIGGFIVAGLSHAPAAGKPGGPSPPLVGWLFALVGFVVFLMTLAIAISKLWAAHCIKLRKSRIYCLVIAALSCMEFPYGTVLGIMTFIVLQRDSVQKQFTAGSAVATTWINPVR